mmetsp:Transcript_10098/g.18385  ORF Transcript_10098/g.18385 Transcript_10098/m.18385 type:complete len:255 (-) Transcript_10098:11-775(-)
MVPSTHWKILERSITALKSSPAVRPIHSTSPSGHCPTKIASFGRSCRSSANASLNVTAWSPSKSARVKPVIGVRKLATGCESAIRLRSSNRPWPSTSARSQGALDLRSWVLPTATHSTSSEKTFSRAKTGTFVLNEKLLTTGSAEATARPSWTKAIGVLNFELSLLPCLTAALFMPLAVVATALTAKLTATAIHLSCGRQAPATMALAPPPTSRAPPRGFGAAAFGSGGTRTMPRVPHAHISPCPGYGWLSDAL